MISVLVISSLLLSGCIDERTSISGTYSHSFKQFSFSKEQVQEFTFYDDGTFYYHNPRGDNSGVYSIKGTELIVTGQLMSTVFIIQEDGTLIDSSNSVWKRRNHLNKNQHEKTIHHT